MADRLKDIIATSNSSGFDSTKNLEAFNQVFANETIFAQELSMSVFCDLKFSKVDFTESRFTGCKFENCTFEKTAM
mgnify:CR=1 FL=1|tara:strand:+ start:728 stop:955 length:228 start_codon:yes stop_codon:yes gene_type:complete